MKTLFVVRGLPGSGKSTLAMRLAPSFAADDFFMEGGEYRFDVSKLGRAHAWCQASVSRNLQAGDVAVANTFTQGWEIQPYVKIAQEREARIVVIDLFDGGFSDEALSIRNVHGVPVDVIRGMRARWEGDWRLADPRPPWERK